jgi:hypothetical protein
MPTRIERSYLEQGYCLPEGLTWERVAELRRRWDVDPVFVPLARSPGCIGWGVPFIAGRPLKHPKSRASGGVRPADRAPAGG